MPPKSPSYKGLKAASEKARAAAKGSSKKADTEPELLLRRALWRLGCRYRKNVPSLPGKPDVVFYGPKVVVFVDGDFWHGRDWPTRRQKLAQGSNPQYWIAKVERNMERDRSRSEELAEQGWRVIRLWESDIRSDPDRAACIVREEVAEYGKSPGGNQGAGSE